MDWAIGLVVRPLIAFAFLVAVLLLKELIRHLLPDSRIKRLLFSPLNRQR